MMEFDSVPRPLSPVPDVDDNVHLPESPGSNACAARILPQKSKLGQWNCHNLHAC
jgi:hypothetical protein